MRIAFILALTIDLAAFALSLLIFFYIFRFMLSVYADEAEVKRRERAVRTLQDY
jgi:hypothetical protein